MKRFLRLTMIAAACACIGGLIALAQRAERGKDVHTAGPYDVSPLETQVLGQSRWLRGGPASLRVVVNDHETDKPVHAGVKISLAELLAGGRQAAFRVLKKDADQQREAHESPPGDRRGAGDLGFD